MSEVINTSKQKIHKTKDIDKISIAGDKVTIAYTETILVETWDKDNNLQSEEKNFIEHQFKGDFLPHEDFLNAFKALRKPLIQVMENNDFDHHDNYRVIGVTYTGQQDEAKVMFTYQKKIDWAHGQLTPAANTIGVPLYDNERYEGAKKIDKTCSKLNLEAWAYMDGKKAESPQMSLEFANGDNMQMRVIEDEPKE